jgi:hypothetical protein
MTTCRIRWRGASTWNGLRIERGSVCVSVETSVKTHARLFSEGLIVSFAVKLPLPHPLYAVSYSSSVEHVYRVLCLVATSNIRPLRMGVG